MTNTEPAAVIPFVVFVDDNFHYMDKEERYQHGAFATWTEAVAACRRIVDEELLGMLKPSMTAEQLFAQYTFFGSDPFIVSAVSESAADRHFSAWDYARERSLALISSDGSSSRDQT
jgi:hypothetical protein